MKKRKRTKANKNCALSFREMHDKVNNDIEKEKRKFIMRLLIIIGFYLIMIGALGYGVKIDVKSALMLSLILIFAFSANLIYFKVKVSMLEHKLSKDKVEAVNEWRIEENKIRKYKKKG